MSKYTVAKVAQAMLGHTEGCAGLRHMGTISTSTSLAAFRSDGNMHADNYSVAVSNLGKGGAPRGGYIRGLRHSGQLLTMSSDCCLQSQSVRAPPVGPLGLLSKAYHCT